MLGGNTSHIAYVTLRTASPLLLIAEDYLKIYPNPLPRRGNATGHNLALIQ